MAQDELEPRRLTLDNLAGGAMQELFQVALERVLANIEDPNSEPTKKRAITFKIVVSSDEKRQDLDFAVACDTKLVAMRPAKAQVRMGRHRGELIAVPAFEQGELFNNPVGSPRVVPVTDR